MKNLGLGLTGKNKKINPYFLAGKVFEEISKKREISDDIFYKIITEANKYKNERKTNFNQIFNSILKEVNSKI